jgi:hypothetical protein
LVANRSPHALGSEHRGKYYIPRGLERTVRQTEGIGGGLSEHGARKAAAEAGVGIASVYEFFPGKHALVAAVVDDTVQAVLAELASGLDQALMQSPDLATPKPSGSSSSTVEMACMTCT